MADYMSRLPALLPGILDLPEPEDSVILEYVYFGNTLQLNTKTRVVRAEPKTVEECPALDVCPLEPMEVLIANQNFADLVLQPVAMYRNPLHKGKHKLVMCEMLNADMTPIAQNTRSPCKVELDRFKEEEAWFGYEQEYVILGQDDWPLGWPRSEGSEPPETNGKLQFTASAGLQRLLSKAHLRACIYAGLDMWGSCKEDYPAVWEFQLAPNEGLKAADQLMIARYLLIRLAELFGVKVSFLNVYPMGPEHYAVFHLNFSTKKMREDGGMAHIHKVIERISKVPQEKLLKYSDISEGRETHKRLLGGLFAPGMDKFRWATGNKWNCAVRIPLSVAKAGKGYIEERRLSSEIDPYQVTRVYILAALEEESSL